MDFRDRKKKAYISGYKIIKSQSELTEVTQMDISLFSNDYIVRRLEKADVPDIYLLCSKNSLYYQYCPPFVTEQSIMDDMKALPPNKEMYDKYYIGY